MIQLDSQIFLWVMGAFFLTAGGLGISGKWKRWYWASRRQVYLYLPMGVLFLLAGVGASVRDQNTSLALRIAEFAVLGVAIWWVFRPPAFLKPGWIRTIEARPAGTYQALAAAVKRGDPWRAKVEDPEELEKWIRAVERGTGKAAKKKS